MLPSETEANKAFALIVSNIVNHVLPEICMVVSAALLTAKARPDSKNFLETIVQDALHKTASGISSSSEIAEPRMYAMLVSAVSAIILSNTELTNAPPHYSKPSEN